MIDLAQVATRIDALPGWTVYPGNLRDDNKFAYFCAYYGYFYIAIWRDGEVSTGLWDGPMMPLLPVLQIVAEAMAHE